MDSEGNYETPAEEALTVQEQRAKYGEEKPRAKDTARLIWASKPKKEPNAKELEFQKAEEVYSNAADTENKKLLFAAKKDIPEQPNRLIWGDNLLVMQALLAHGYEGQIDLIYIDPPFNTGENFNFPNEINLGEMSFEKELPVSERLAYSDTWDRGVDSFLDMLYPRLQLMKKLLSQRGAIYIHLDSNAVHYAKIICDEIFGSFNFIAEIIWSNESASGFKAQANKWIRGNDTILMYSVSRNYYFQKQYALLSDSTVKRYDKKDKEGRSYKEYFEKNGEIRKVYLDQSKGKPLTDTWHDIISFQTDNASREHLGYPTQKPEKMLRRIIESSSKEGGLIADFFCGSGTTAAIAEKLGRRWITSDLSKTAIQITRSRLVNQGSNPFVIENLGNYQRQLIYAKEVNLKQMYNIILKLYGASPREDWQGFGVSKEDNKTVVFVCEPDRSMTARKAIELAKLARTADGKGYKRLIILAWDYDYDFDDVFDRMKKNAKSDMADVEFKIIPSDVYKYLRSTKVGDSELKDKITFYEKPYIVVSEPDISRKDSEEPQVKLKIENYAVMDIPVKDESKRPEIQKLLGKNFAYLIDYWTVDWDYDGEVFRSKWQAIRDRKSSDPVLVIAEATLSKGKKYTIAIRVVDVFGNDASVTKEIDLR